MLRICGAGNVWQSEGKAEWRFVWQGSGEETARYRAAMHCIGTETWMEAEEWRCNEREKESVSMEKMKVRLRFKERVLGTASANPDLHREYIASKAPDAKTIDEEVASIGVDAVEEKSMTVFPKEDGKPFLYDYQIKGFFKNACKAMRLVEKSASSKMTAYKTKIDNLIFVDERKIFFENPDGGDVEIGNLQRPLRASTAQGERVALANSESVPEGTEVEFTISALVPEMMKQVREWLDYGELNGIGQWHNSGCGRFTWEEV